MLRRHLVLMVGALAGCGAAVDAPSDTAPSDAYDATTDTPTTETSLDGGTETDSTESAVDALDGGATEVESADSSADDDASPPLPTGVVWARQVGLASGIANPRIAGDPLGGAWVVSTSAGGPLAVGAGTCGSDAMGAAHVVHVLPDGTVDKAFCLVDVFPEAIAADKDRVVVVGWMYRDLPTANEAPVVHVIDRLGKTEVRREVTIAGRARFSAVALGGSQIFVAGTSNKPIDLGVGGTLGTGDTLQFVARIEVPTAATTWASMCSDCRGGRPGGIAVRTPDVVVAGGLFEKAVFGGVALEGTGLYLARFASSTGLAVDGKVVTAGGITEVGGLSLAGAVTAVRANAPGGASLAGSGFEFVVRGDSALVPVDGFSWMGRGMRGGVTQLADLTMGVGSFYVGSNWVLHIATSDGTTAGSLPPTTWSGNSVGFDVAAMDSSLAGVVATVDGALSYGAVSASGSTGKAGLQTLFVFGVRPK